MWGQSRRGHSLASHELFVSSDKTANAQSLTCVIDVSDQRGPCPTEQFVMSGLRAARSAHPNLRRTILGDLAQVLGCTADELDFLFCDPVVAANDSDPVIMPDYRRMLHEDMFALA